MPSLGALTSQKGPLTGCPHFPKAPPCRRRVVVASSHRAVVSSVCASILTASILTAILTRVLIPGPQCVVAPSCRRARPYPHRYPHRPVLTTRRRVVVAYRESMRRCNDCEGLGGCSEARVVVASSSPRRRRGVASFRGGKNLYASWLKLLERHLGATPAHSRRVVVVASPRSPNPLRPRVRAVLHACSSSSRGRTWRSARAFVEASDLEKHKVPRKPQRCRRAVPGRVGPKTTMT